MLDASGCDEWIISPCGRSRPSRPTQPSTGRYGPRSAERERHRGILEDRADVREELRPLSTVDDPVVERQPEPGDHARADFVVDHPGLRPDRAERHDRYLAPVED